MPKITIYQPYVCPNEECLGYGDTVPAEYGKCFLCYTPLVLFSKIPYDHLNSFVRRILNFASHPLAASK